MFTGNHTKMTKSLPFEDATFRDFDINASLKCNCESRTIKKAERQRIDAFELWYWRRLLRVPWTARRSNQSILKEISSKYSLEGPMLKLKLQYFSHRMQRTDFTGKDPDAVKD